MGNTLMRKKKGTESRKIREMFLEAAASGDTQIVRDLLASGVQVDAPDLVAREEVADTRAAFLCGLELSDGAVGEFAQSEMFDPHVLEMVLAMGCPWPRETTPLHVAAAADQTEIVELLIANGARLEAKDDEGFTAMTLACRERHVRTMAVLINAKASVNSQCDQGSTPLMWASWNGHTGIVDQLLDANADPDIQNKYGQTSLMFAAFDNQVAVVKTLLDRDADPGLWNEDGQTALMSASHEGHSEVVELLLAAGRPAAINHQDINGRTALMFGAWKGHQRLVQALLYSAANGNLQDMDGRTALMMTAWKGHANIVEILLEDRYSGRVNPDMRDKDNQTALIWAAAACRLECIKLLLDADADPMVADNEGRTALFCSQSRQHTAAVELFEQYSSPKTHIPRGLSHYALHEIASGTCKLMPPAVERLSDQHVDYSHVEQLAM